MKARAAGPAAIKMVATPRSPRSDRLTSHGRRPYGSAISGQSEGQYASHDSVQQLNVGAKVSGTLSSSVWTSLKMVCWNAVKVTTAMVMAKSVIVDRTKSLQQKAEWRILRSAMAKKVVPNPNSNERRATVM